MKENKQTKLGFGIVAGIVAMSALVVVSGVGIVGVIVAAVKEVAENQLL